MLINQTRSPSYGTDPVAGDVRSALRPATFQAARRADDAHASAGRAGTFNVDALYPNLSFAPVRPSIVAAAGRRIATAAAALAMVVTVGAQYTIVDEHGHVVGSLVTDTPPARLRIIGATNAARAALAPQPDPRADRTVHPDYANALSAEQLSRAWQAEMDRLAPPPATGGG
jgi:hypothetical protein